MRRTGPDIIRFIMPHVELGCQIIIGSLEGFGDDLDA